MNDSRLGPYELGKTLGKGGMGVVRRATERDTGRQVAVKVLSPLLAQQEGFRERFEAEIETLETLRHDGIVRLLGYGEQEGTLYYAMELVEGTSLEEELRSGRRFHWREVADIAIQVCKALKHAHDHGVIHRDIKPANILLAENDKIKLADFGIARLFGGTQLTSAGGILGTADYMAPEQAAGEPISERTDQYSLGGVMYALLAGKPPFKAKSLPEMLQLQRFAEPEPVRRRARDTPVELERVIMQLLGKNPADRFPNTLVLARHLEAMVRALSRPNDDDFDLAENDPAWRATRPMTSEAILAEQQLGETRLESEVAPQDAESLQEEGTLLADSAADGVSIVLADESTSHDRFTAVSDEHQSEWGNQSPFWLQRTLPWITGLLLTIATFFIAREFLRPASAEELLAHIDRAAAEGDTTLRQAETEVTAFLQQYPTHARAPDVKEYQSMIDVMRHQKRLQRTLRFGNSGESLAPIEELTMDALADAETAPARAATKLRAILDLYDVDGQSEDDKPEARTLAICIELVKSELQRLDRELTDRAERQLPELQARFEQAVQLYDKSPGKATVLFRAIVTLYDDHPWAQQIVDQSRNYLTKKEKE